MELRAIEIGPEHEQRLRELLKIHEKAVDTLSDCELDKAEQDFSQRILHLAPSSYQVKMTIIRTKAGLASANERSSFFGSGGPILYPNKFGPRFIT